MDEDDIAREINQSLLETGFEKPPVTLLTIAANRKIKAIRRALIVPEGCLAVRSDGFEVTLRGRPDSLIDHEDQLNPRERFVVAHEISHTFFYRRSLTSVEKLRAISPARLEQLCQFGASRILVPEKTFAIDVAGLGLDLDLLKRLAGQYRTSVEVIINRLDGRNTKEDTSRVVVFCNHFKADMSDATIRAVYFPDTFLRYFPKPKRFSPLKQWAAQNAVLKKRLLSELLKQAESTVEIAVENGSLFFRSTRVGASSFILELIFKNQPSRRHRTE